MGPRAQRADKLQRAGRDFKSVTYGPGIKTVTYVIGTDLELDGAPGEIRTPDLLVRRTPGVLQVFTIQQVRWPALA